MSETLHTLYEAFSRRDGEAMAACYAPDAAFEDPVFRVSGRDVGDMWRMLTSRGEDLRIEYRIVDDAHAEWTADYTFGGRPVHNEVRSEFNFDADGRITKQADTFDFRKWAGQALGWKGKALGRFGFLQAAVRRTSAETLARWQQRRGEAVPPPS